MKTFKENIEKVLSNCITLDGTTLNDIVEEIGFPVKIIQMLIVYKRQFENLEDGVQFEEIDSK